MESIKKIIIAILIAIIVLIIILIFLINSKNKMTENNEVLNSNDAQEVIPDKDNNGFEEVTDNNIFFSIIDALSSYIDMLKYNENFSIDEEVSNTSINTQNLEIIYNLLDKDYIKDNNIKLNNIQNYIYNINSDTILIPIKMKAKYGENINTFILETYLTGSYSEKKYFIVRIDNKNQAFSIEFVTDKVNKIEDLKFKENENNIYKNDYNHFEYQIINEDRIAISYLENYRNLSINYPEIVYNDYLDDDYKNERFGSLENYKKFINDNLQELEQIETKKYLLENKGDNSIYVCVDQYKNTYTFTVTSVLQYKVKLDTYSIISEKFLTTYNKSNNNDKVMMNVDKFIMMLNNRDYGKAYSVLDKEFRNNTFGNEENFEQYMRVNYPLHYDIEYNSFNERGSNIFIQEITLTDTKGEYAEKIKFIIIMKLQEGTDFVMSFKRD